jgi:CheY-like chemotaxis protein
MQRLNNESFRLPDVHFLDINMPRKNGIECLSEIKRNTKLKDIPVIIFSTSNSKDKIGVVFKSGADVYIHKPGDFSQLKQVILHALPIAVENIYSNGSLKYILNA